MSFLDSKLIYFIVVFLCAINLISDALLGYYIFIVIFGLIAFLLTFYIKNSTIVLFTSLIITNIIIMKYDKLRLLRTGSSGFTLMY